MADKTDKTDKTAQQTFDFETMAIVLYVMGGSGVTLSIKHYEMMSAATGNKRGKDSFNHQFRKVKARAKEIADGMGEGDAAPAKKAPAKRARKSKAEDEGGSPTKKRKVVKKESAGSGSNADAPGSEVAE